jgi:thioredoxin 2
MVRTCGACGQKNRIRAANLASNVRCGRCKTAIAPVREPIEADAATFDEIVQQVSVPVLVDFWADWCGPCHMAAPEVKKVAESMAGRAIVLKVDTDRYPEIGERFHVRGIPNFVVLRNGQAVFQQAGVVSQAQMERWLEQHAV